MAAARAKTAGGAAICGALLVSAGIDTVETTFGVMSTVSVGGGIVHTPRQQP